MTESFDCKPALRTGTFLHFTLSVHRILQVSPLGLRYSFNRLRGFVKLLFPQDLKVPYSISYAWQVCSFIIPTYDLFRQVAEKGPTKKLPEGSF